MSGNKMALDALTAAQRAINSMKVEAETAGAGGDQEMLQDACEQISNEGLAADTAIRAAIAALQAEPQGWIPFDYANPPEDGLMTREKSRSALAFEVITWTRKSLCVQIPLLTPPSRKASHEHHTTASA